VCSFCLLIRRDVVDAIGWFDPIFSPGYGEESDYHLRAVTSGFRAVVADDTYVYHRGETSFKNRTELWAERLKIFSRRWSGEYDRLLAEYERRDELGYLRDRQTTMPLFEKYSYVPTYDVVFILPGLRSRIGGIYTVAEIVNGLVESGKHANVGYFGEKNLDADLLFEPIRYSDNEELLAFPPPTKILVATEYRTVYPVARAHESCGTSPVYFIQDYEGWFEPLSLLSVVKATYGRIDRRIAISRWVHDMIEQEDGYESTVINVGVADDDFYKRNKIPVELEDLRRNHKILVFASLIGYERRGSAYFIQAMKELLSTTRDIAFVVTQSPDKRLLDLSDPRIVSVGLIDRSQMPAYLSACDIIVDASLYHGFGLPALEGMSCGLAAVMTDVQVEYARNGLNCILIEPRSVKQLKGAILRLRDDPDLLSRMKEEARKTAVEYSWRNLLPRYEAYFEELLRSVREPPLPLYYDYGKLLARYAFHPHGGKDSPVAFPVDPLPSPSEMLRRFSVYAKRDGVKAALKFAFGWLFK
jgi:glycosyltransferase involved in cell wall biosynthesis